MGEEYYEIIKSDFNEIAQLGDDPKWNHNNCFFPHLLGQVPENAEVCLEIGSGKGELTALLAKQVKKVIAVDIAEKMVEYAGLHNDAEKITYVCGNILDLHYESSTFDLIISTATAHHLPFEWLLDFAKDKLRPGGKLILLDLAKADTFTDYLIWGFASVANIIMNLIKNRKPYKDEPRARKVWERHGKHDSYMTIKEIKSFAEKHIPGAVVRRELFWRYVLVWQK